eukprot:SAG25_NODE_6938_length_517_cov_0.806220_1_plen_117_part_10
MTTGASQTEGRSGGAAVGCSKFPAAVDHGHARVDSATAQPSSVVALMLPPIASAASAGASAGPVHEGESEAAQIRRLQGDRERMQRDVELLTMQLQRLGGGDEGAPGGNGAGSAQKS